MEGLPPLRICDAKMSFVLSHADGLGSVSRRRAGFCLTPTGWVLSHADGLNLRHTGKILIISLPQGQRGIEKSALLDSLILSQLHLAALTVATGGNRNYPLLWNQLKRKRCKRLIAIEARCLILFLQLEDGTMAIATCPEALVLGLGLLIFSIFLIGHEARADDLRDRIAEERAVTVKLLTESHPWNAVAYQGATLDL